MASIYDHLPKPELKAAGATGAKRRARVLVVDDQPINVKLLERKLEREGMEPLLAENGRQCIEIARAELPDLILLDVMMPEVDGIEACRILNADPKTREIPIIFITARSGKEGKLEGLGAGAVDYIVKPIDLDETMARVRTHLKMREYNRENLALQQRLADVRRQALVGQLTLGLSHNLNNLLGIVVGYLDLMRTAPGNRALLERGMDGMDNGLRRIGDVISQVLVLGEHRAPVMYPVLLGDVIREAIQTHRLDHDYPDEISLNLGEFEDFRFLTNAETVEAALIKLIQNAHESATRVPGNVPRLAVTATVESEGDDARVHIRIQDNGTGLESSVRDSLFDPFISVKSEVGAGMGLPLARHGIELLGGTLELENAGERGALATITLPVPPEPVASPMNRGRTL